MAKLARQVGIYSIKTEKQIGDLRKDMERWKDEVIGQFHVVAEDIRHDLIGATKDDLQLLKDTDRRHEKRIVRLEQHAGLLAA